MPLPHAFLSQRHSELPSSGPFPSGLMSKTKGKPPIIVSCMFPNPSKGSEAGKAFSWTLALEIFFEVHVICLDTSAEACAKSELCKNWNFYPISMPAPRGPSLWWYNWYRMWCGEVVEKILEIRRTVQPVGIHHPVMGSFRMLPRFDVTGIKYTLGPLGGGEFLPAKFAVTAGFPPLVCLEELLRPAINLLTSLHPLSKPVLSGAEHCIATTEESARIIRKAGATRVSIAFPDVFETQSDPVEVMARRKLQAEELRKEVRLIFSGRAMWWKGGHLALRVLQRLHAMGCNATLQMVTQGPAVESWRVESGKMGIADHVRWSGFVSRPELFELQSHSHVFVYPTIHDSSSSAIPEAYATGLPTVTLGIGGAGAASTPATGFNAYLPDATQWVNQAASAIEGWIADPTAWLLACGAAVVHSRNFSQKHIEDVVRRVVVPAFIPKSEYDFFTP